jgi:hypothetical protein
MERVPVGIPERRADVNAKGCTGPPGGTAQLLDPLSLSSAFLGRHDLERQTGSHSCAVPADAGNRTFSKMSPALPPA